jgi:hypothetical protein
MEGREIVQSHREGRDLSLVVRGNLEKIMEKLRSHSPETMDTQALTLEEIFVASLA